MQQFQDIVSYSNGLVSDSAFARSVSLAEIFPNLDEIQPDLNHTSIEVNNGVIIPLTSISVTPFNEYFGVEGMEEYAHIQDKIKFKNLEVGVFFYDFENNLICQKIGQTLALEMYTSTRQKVKGKRCVQPLSAAITFGRALQLRTSTKVLGKSDASSEAEVVADTPHYEATMLEATPASEPEAAVKIKIVNKGKKSKTKVKAGSKKGKKSKKSKSKRK